MEIHGAGRTDAGVHAAGQVANAKFHTDLSDEELLQTINHYLPEDIEVTSLARMPERFHSRLNAADKTYEWQKACFRAEIRVFSGSTARCGKNERSIESVYRNV